MVNCFDQSLWLSSPSFRLKHLPPISYFEFNGQPQILKQHFISFSHLLAPHSTSYSSLWALPPIWFGSPPKCEGCSNARQPKMSNVLYNPISQDLKSSPLEDALVLSLGKLRAFSLGTTPIHMHLAWVLPITPFPNSTVTVRVLMICPGPHSQMPP